MKGIERTMSTTNLTNTLSVRVASRKTEQGEWYEGTVSIQGLKPTKLARKSDGSTQFPTRSAVSGAARNLAKSLGFTDVDVTDATAASNKPTVKKAAKKSSAVPVKKTSSKPKTKTTSNT